MITVVATYRTGSSTFCQRLQALTGYKYFNDEVTGETLHESKKEYTYPIHYDRQIHKVMPAQLRYWEQKGHAPLLDYVMDAQHRFYIVRENISEQIISFALAKKSLKFHPWTKGWEILPDVKSITLDELVVYEDFIRTEIAVQARLYKQYPGILVKYEDVFSEEDRYERPNIIMPVWNTKLNLRDYFPNI